MRIAVFLAILSGSLSAQFGSEFNALQRRIVNIYNDNSSGVIRVFAAHSTYDEKGDLQEGVQIGTGCFISREGHILAAASVVLNSKRTWFEFKGINYTSELIGVERSTNLALIKANNLPENFSFFIPEANQIQPDVGSLAVMISCPLDFAPSPSLAMIAGAETRFGNREFPTTHLRVNKRVRGGEGGAPLIGLNGRFLGILAWSAPDIESGYVLPARAILRVRDDLLFAGKFIHGWIGIDIKDRSTIRDGLQIFLAGIVEESPAALAGLKQGDVLVRMGDFSIQSFSDVRNAMFFARAGQFLDVQVFREGVLQDYTVKVTERPEDQPTSPDPAEITNPSDEGTTSPESEVTEEEKPS
jgi:S1-C subfamily serine protease